ncbi:MAG: hypothetical protein E1N59_2807 [Puniceicoccaceae bacterium 5H]|nr:MAG: hypothetical protein E1N59_2807 [Puniceicoccaceae bacterium 5H]
MGTDVASTDPASWALLATGLAVLLTLAVSRWAQSSGSLVLAVFSRWLRWISIAVIGASMIYSISQDYPFWALIAVCFLGWFLLETGYNWMAINAISHSELPLFPRFETNRRGDEWPSQKRFIELRNWLRHQDLHRVDALVTRAGEQELQRVSIYRNEDDSIRLHVFFMPTARQQILTCYALHSITEDGERVITDNVFMPYGGFYPEKWLLERRPWKRSLPGLWKRHLERMDAHGGPFVALEVDPQTMINNDQRTLERLNRQLGFLSDGEEQEEQQGRISAEGRFRMWTEVWMLGYLGRSHRY